MSLLCLSANQRRRNISHAVPPIFLIHCDGTVGSNAFTDVYGHTVTATGSVVVANPPGGGLVKSAYFPGNGVLNVAPSADLNNILADDFTFEGWFYLTAYNIQFVGNRNADTADTSGFSLQMYSFGWFFQYYNASHGIATAVHTIHTPAPPLNAWCHIAMTYNKLAGIVQIYINGIKGGSDLVLSAPIGSNTVTTNPFSIGGPVEIFTDKLRGYGGEFRLTPAILYAGNFTPPPAPF